MTAPAARLNPADRHPFLKRQEWHPLTPADLKRCELEAQIRDAGRPNPKPMTNNPHLKGIIGELVYGRIIGEEPKWGRLAGGDGGEDFSGGINVRARQLRGIFPPRLYVTENDLRAHPSTRVYVLVAVDMDNMEAAPLGWATRAEVEAAPIEENTGWPAHYIPGHKLRQLPVAPGA